MIEALPLLQLVEPAGVFVPDQLAGPVPAVFGWLNEGSLTLLPLIVKLKSPRLFVSSSSSASSSLSAVACTECSSFIPGVSRSTETVALWPTPSGGVAASFRTVVPSSRSSVVVAGAPSVPTFWTVAEIVTFSPARALLLDAVIPLTTRSGWAASCTAASASIRPQP